MDTVIFYLIVIPMAIMAFKFWAGAVKYGLKHKDDLARRIQKVRSAFDEAGHPEE